MSIMNIGNARDPEQARRMKALTEAGKCYFCRQGSAENKTLPEGIIREGHYWYIKANDFPVEGSIHHYLIVSIRHATEMTELAETEELELFQIMRWLQTHLDVNGFSFFVRNGDTRYTGATMDHLHCHFIVGGQRPENFTLTDALPVVLGYKKTK
jgi:ATP adenylyltransferase